MFRWFSPKPRSMIGVDIGSTAVKILAISTIDGKPCIEAYGCGSLPAGMGTNAIKETDAITTLIKELLLQHNFPHYTAVIAIPDSLVISKIIQLSAHLNKAEIEEAVLIEANNYLTHPLDEINVDFKIRGYSSTTPTMRDVLMIASKADYVNRRVKAVSHAGLKVNIVDVESYAVERTVRLITKELPLQQGKVVILINIGSALTHFFVLSGPNTLFTREEIFGDRQLLELTMQHYGIAYEEALHLQTRDTLPADYVMRVLQPFADNLLLQMQRALQFFSYSHDHSSISHVLLSGSGDKLAELAFIVQEKTGYPTQLVDLLKYLAISKRLNRKLIINAAPSLMIACGLALRDGGMESDDGY